MNSFEQLRARFLEFGIMFASMRPCSRRRRQRTAEIKAVLGTRTAKSKAVFAH
jgi:hypothetical protein